MGEVGWESRVAVTKGHCTFQLPPPLPLPLPTGFSHWREELQLGDSDSESDDDIRGVVGLNADWTKEAEPEHKTEQ